MFSALRRGFLLLFLLPLVACNGESPGQMRGLSLSPDGKFVAVTYLKDATCFIYKVAMDSGNARRLTQAKAGWELSPAFSADGKLIAYSYEPDKIHQQIIVMHVDGSNPRTLVGSKTANTYSSFAPNGGRVYFGRSQPSPHEHEWDVFSVDIDGDSVEQVTHEGFYHISKPSLSPDGKNMLLQTEESRTEAAQEIRVYSLERPAKPKLVVQPQVTATPHAIFEDPSYMPDGKSIVFLAATDGRAGYDYDVYRMTLGTGSLEKLTNANGFASDLSLSADGKTAMFLKWKSDWHRTPTSSEVYLLDLQTHGLTPFKITGLN